ncbi:hypothetical protein QYF36_023765 [Acer negundo]|nr:hypothetical protein QYF36_023765 [Acer negundo]
MFGPWLKAPSPVKSGQYCGRREEASNGVSMRHVSGHEEDVPIPNLIVEQRQASELIKAKSAVTEKSAPIELTVTDFVWQTNSGCKTKLDADKSLAREDDNFQRKTGHGLKVGKWKRWAQYGVKVNIGSRVDTKPGKRQSLMEEDSVIPVSKFVRGIDCHRVAIDDSLSGRVQSAC